MSATFLCQKQSYFTFSFHIISQCERFTKQSVLKWAVQTQTKMQLLLTAAARQRESWEKVRWVMLS